MPIFLGATTIILFLNVVTYLCFFFFWGSFLRDLVSTAEPHLSLFFSCWNYIDSTWGTEEVFRTCNRNASAFRYVV